ncbi:MAG: hypothetical protein KJ890_15610 [Gammaproteobacteria bacterium]|nr:hypothetical protein [Gammaproteobacteria bacterium]MBU1803856.1 hypothetical protein [Gammaproteobacteria bacterium]
MKMPPQNRTLITPPEGWEPESWYQVEVSFNRNNPVHRALLFTGFLHDGQPGNYHYLTSSGWEELSKLDELHYLSPLKQLGRLTKADYEEDGALERLRTLLEKLLPYAEAAVASELFGGGCGPQMEEDLELIREAKELLE